MLEFGIQRCTASLELWSWTWFYGRIEDFGLDFIGKLTLQTYLCGGIEGADVTWRKTDVSDQNSWKN